MARFYLGLDLGCVQDFSALVALERTDVPDPEAPRGTVRRFEVRGARRWPLRTAYHQIAEDVAELVEGPPLAGCVLGIDRTGVGVGVLEIIKAARPKAQVRAVTITAGYQAHVDADGYHVPKVELVGAVTAALESDRLSIPPTIREAATLGKELAAFRAKVTPSGRETMEADWRQRAHDDLVLGLAIALYLGTVGQTFWVR